MSGNFRNVDLRIEYILSSFGNIVQTRLLLNLVHRIQIHVQIIQMILKKFEVKMLKSRMFYNKFDIKKKEFI